MGLWILNHIERALWVLMIPVALVVMGRALLQGNLLGAVVCVGVLPFIGYKLARVNRLMR